MPFSGPEANEAHLRDLEVCAEAILSFIEGMNFDAYCKDRKTRSAVERQLQIISEVAVRLGDFAEALCPGIDWQKVRGPGIILRHIYQDLEDDKIWGIVTQYVPALLASVQDARKGYP